MRTNGTAMRRLRTATTDVNSVYKKMRSTASLMRVVDGRGFRYFEACKSSMSVLKFSCKNFSFLFFKTCMREYFKICVVLLTAFGCSRALCGVKFYCELCNEGVKWEEWGNHAEQKHNGKYQEPSILMCPYSSCRCLLTPSSKSFTVNGTSVKCADDHMRSVHGDKFVTYELWCEKCQTVVSRYFWEMHLVQKHGYIDLVQSLVQKHEYIDWVQSLVQKHGYIGLVQKNGLYYTPCYICRTKRVLCKKSEPEQSNRLGQPCISPIPYKDSDASENSNMTFPREDSDFKCVCPRRGCDTDLMELSKDRFFCNKCDQNEGKDKCDQNEGEGITWYCLIDHLFAKHKDQVKDYLPQYAFYCRECNKVLGTAEEWGRHVYGCEGRLKKESKMQCFYCPLCKVYPATSYEAHIGGCHSNQCIYCFQTFNDESKRKEHMKKAHKILCPFCNHDEFEVPLTVHIARDHEIWEGPCLWKRRYEVRCKLCKMLFRYSIGGPCGGENMKGFYVPGETYLQKVAVQHWFGRAGKYDYSSFEGDGFKYDLEDCGGLDDNFKHGISKARFEKLQEWRDRDEFIMQNIIKVQRTSCNSLYSRYSGYHVLEGHNNHRTGKFTSCVYCQSPLVPKDDGKRYTLEEVVDGHWKLFHENVKYCRPCDSIYPKEEYDKHLISKHKDEYWECPECKKAVQKEDLHHGGEKHDKGIAFCTECNRIGTGSCPDCGEWVSEECKKCPQRIYGRCPQCWEAAFESCPDCYQYVTGTCDRCGKEVNGECLKCCEKVSGECPVCGKRAAGWCSECKQRVVGTCLVCRKQCTSGACSDCRQRVGVDQKIYSALKSHMKKKHGEKLQLDKKAIEWLEGQAARFKADKTFRWCEACGIPVPNANENKALIAHCRDRHKYSEHGWCALCKWDFDGTREEHLRRNHGNKMEHCYGCDRDVLSRLSKWHSMRHVCYCIECNREVPFGHMITEHRCTLACKPTVDLQKHVWIFNHDKNCKNYGRWRCNLEDCEERGSGDDAFREHIIEYHGCTKECKCQREGFQFKVEHHLPDGKRCDVCKRDVIHGLSKWHSRCHFCYCLKCNQFVRFEHMVEEHGCTSACKPTVDFQKPVWIFNHDKNCKNRGWWQCNFEGCKEKGSGDEAFREHIINKHGCTKDCKCQRENFQFKVHHSGCDHDEEIQVNCPFNECGFRGARVQVLSHVYKLHGCSEEGCAYNKNGQFEHAIVCENRIWECPFAGCNFSNTPQEIRNHMHKGHECINAYCTFEKGDPDHCVICPNRVFKCPACHASSVTKRHLKEVHGCDKFCHDNGDGGVDHLPDCKNRHKF